MRHYGQYEHDSVRHSQADGPLRVRVGTPALTTRGMGESTEMKSIGLWMLEALKNPTDATIQQRIRGEVSSLCQQFPVPAAKLTV